MMTIREIAEELNRRAEGYEIGKLQEIRKELKQFSSATEARHIFVSVNSRIFRISSWWTQRTSVQCWLGLGRPRKVFAALRGILIGNKPESARHHAAYPKDCSLQ